MNKVDLRISYNRATGLSPVECTDVDGVPQYRCDRLTAPYVIWLIERFYDGNRDRFLIEEYKRSTGEDGIYRHTGALPDSYSDKFMVWAEDYMMNSGLLYMEEDR